MPPQTTMTDVLLDAVMMTKGAVPLKNDSLQ